MDYLVGIILTCFILGLIILAIYHPISAISRLYLAKRKNSKYAIGLKKYLMVVVIYFSILIFTSHFGINVPGSAVIVYLFGIPTIIATWYIRFTIKWDKKHSRIDQYDNLSLQNQSNKNRLELDRFPRKFKGLKSLKKEIKLKVLNA